MEHSVPELVKEVCREIGALVPCDRIALALPSPEGDTFAVFSLLPADTDVPDWEMAREGSCADKVLKRRRAERCPSLGTEFRYAEEAILHGQGVRDAAFIPLYLGAAPFGVLILGAEEPRALEGKGLGRLERLAGLLSVALAAAVGGPPDRRTADRPGPSDDPQRSDPGHSYRQMAAYSGVSSRIVQEDDLNAACRIFLEAIREHSGYGRAILTLLDEQGRDSQWLFTGFSDDDIDYFHAHTLSPEQRVALLREPHRLGNSYFVPVTAGIDFGLARRASPAQGVLFLPLHGAGGRLVGTVMLADPRREGAPAAGDLCPLELFANQVAHAIEKKRLDRAVKSAQARLRGAQEQLMQMEKMSAIGQLISGVTHELNNPLSGIMGFAQLMMGSELNPKTRKNLERIYNEAVRSQKIVQNLLGFSRRHKPEKTFRNLNEVIDSVLELRAYQFQVDDIEVERRYDSALPGTMFDFHQLQQVIFNVINNAHQAIMDAGSRPRRLVIVTTASDGMLQAAFTDSGPGIPRDRLEKVFDPFFTTKDKGKGTGLGLSLSRAIIRDHKGSLSASSMLGQGTTIRLELPRLEEAPVMVSPGTAARPTEPGREPMNLLVVDDEAILVELLTDFLISHGHNVDHAGDGRRALALASARSYDIILTDLKMPGLDGLGLYDRLVKEKPQMAQRFIFSTGDLANPKTQTFFQRTGCLYLSKPFKLDSVLTVLDQLQTRLRAA